MTGSYESMITLGKDTMQEGSRMVGIGPRFEQWSVSDICSFPVLLQTDASMTGWG